MLSTGDCSMQKEGQAKGRLHACILESTKRTERVSLPAEPCSSMRKALAGTTMRNGSVRMPGSWARALPASPRPRLPDSEAVRPDSDLDIPRWSGCPLPMGCPRPSTDITAR